MQIDSEIYKELKYISTLDSCQERLRLYLKELKPKKTRSLSQNNAIHVDCEIISQKLNDAGKDMRVVLKPTFFIPWSMKSVKEFLWKPVMKAMYQKESTTELDKTSGEIDMIHEVIMRELGEKHGIEHHDFPSRKKEELPEYPTEELTPTF